MNTINKIFEEITALENERDELEKELAKTRSDPERHYISPICPLCHPEPGRLYVQAAETTCDYQCNLCHTEFNVCIQDKKTDKVYAK